MNCCRLLFWGLPWKWRWVYAMTIKRFWVYVTAAVWHRAPIQLIGEVILWSNYISSFSISAQWLIEHRYVDETYENGRPMYLYIGLFSHFHMRCLFSETGYRTSGFSSFVFKVQSGNYSQSFSNLAMQQVANKFILLDAFEIFCLLFADPEECSLKRASIAAL